MPERDSYSPDAIAVAIFDLDDTLYDCFGQRLLAAHRHASRAMVEAGVPATADQIFEARMRAFARDPQLEYIDAEVCRHFQVKDRNGASRAARAAFFSTPVAGPLTLFPGALRVLRALKARGVRIFIVTFGDPATQRAKVKALGLQSEPSVERICYTESGNVSSKEEAFAEILRQTGMRPAQVLVVGDRPNREILAGKRLGLRTVRLRHGEFASLEAQGAGEQADWEITQIDSVLDLPVQFAGQTPAAKNPANH